MNTTSPEALRNRLVDQLTEAGTVRTAAVETAMRTVPRHEHVPDVSTETAYANASVTIKPGADPDGLPLSCASEPAIVAMMLEQLDVKPGDHILEVGAGTGYNAALLAFLTGPNGQVTTVDIDPDVTAHARKALDATGNDRVHVATRDGALGDHDHAPYDKMTVTVGAWDLPTAWWQQLADEGRLVVPLRWRGTTRSVAFTLHGDQLHSVDMQLCGFVPMLGQDGERDGSIDADGTVNLYWDIDQNIAPAALTGVLDQPKAQSWSGVSVGGEEPFDGVWLRMSATDPATCRIEAKSEAVKSGLCTPAIPSRSPALAEGGSLAYFLFRRQEGQSPARFELGATGHGPAGQDLADRLCGHIRAWGQDRTAQPHITVYPADATTPVDAGHVITKRDSRLVFTWPK